MTHTSQNNESPNVRYGQTACTFSNIGAFTPAASLGQALSEYALSVSLVAMVAIGGLIMVGDNLGKTTGNMKTLVVGHPVTITGPTSVGTSSTISVASTLPLNQNGKNCYSNGWCLDVSKIQASTVVSTITTGSNGMVMLESNTTLLDQLAQQAALSTTDPALKALLTKLANSGHGVGNTSQSVITNGEQGKYNVYPQLGTANQTFATTQDDLLSYLSSHPDILPAEIQQTIMAATAQIKDTANNLFIAAKNAADAYDASATTSTSYTIASTSTGGSYSSSGGGSYGGGGGGSYGGGGGGYGGGGGGGGGSYGGGSSSSGSSATIVPTTTTTHTYTWDLSEWTADPTIIHTDSNNVCNNGGDTSKCNNNNK
jgi:hypothetical protein